MSWQAERGGATGFNCAKSPVKDIGRWLNEAVVLELRASAGRPPLLVLSLTPSTSFFVFICVCMSVCVSAPSHLSCSADTQSHHRIDTRQCMLIRT